MLIVLAILAVFLLPSPWGFVAVVGALAGEVLELVFWRRFLRRYRVQVGVESLMGQEAQVVEACSPLGRVRVRGELWTARSRAPVAEGETVTIVGIDGLTLEVEPAG